MSLDLEELKRLAQAATPGPWEIKEHLGYDEAYCDWHQVGAIDLQGGEASADSQFIRSANPAAVLALIERVERAESRTAVLVRELLEYKHGDSCSVEDEWDTLDTKGCECVLRLVDSNHPGAGLLARVANLEALARRAWSESHVDCRGCDLSGREECSHPHCREWAAALEAKP